MIDFRWVDSSIEYCNYVTSSTSLMSLQIVSRNFSERISWSDVINASSSTFIEERKRWARRRRRGGGGLGGGGGEFVFTWTNDTIGFRWSILSLWLPATPRKWRLFIYKLRYKEMDLHRLLRGFPQLIAQQHCSPINVPSFFLFNVIQKQIHRDTNYFWVKHE